MTEDNNGVKILKIPIILHAKLKSKASRLLKGLYEYAIEILDEAVKDEIIDLSIKEE